MHDDTPTSRPSSHERKLADIERTIARCEQAIARLEGTKRGDAATLAILRRQLAEARDQARLLRCRPLEDTEQLSHLREQLARWVGNQDPLPTPSPPPAFPGERANPREANRWPVPATRWSPRSRD